MTTQPFQLDPDVEHILQEVAKDPRSSLLRVERPKIIRGLMEREPSVGVATAGLTSAERHLVQTRRAETAFALRALCLQAILADPRGKHLISRQSAATEQQLSRLLANLRKGLAADETAAVGEFATELNIARHALARRPGGVTDVLQLSAVAQRLEPTDISRIHAANQLQLDEQHRGAIALLLNVSSLRASSLIGAVVGANLGLAFHKLGLFSDSMRWYRHGCDQREDFVPTAAGRLMVALQLGDRSEAIAAGALLDEHNAPDSPEILWQCASEGARRNQFQAHLSKAGRELIPKLRARFGATTRTLVDAVK